MSEEGPFQSPWNFLGLPQDLASPERARAWVVPVPYKSTTSYGAGTRNGPAAIIAASRQVELFDIEFGNEPAAEYGILTTNPLALVHRNRALDQRGETGEPELLCKIGGIGETARDLTHRLCTICERKEWADEALAYNGLVLM